MSKPAAGDPPADPNQDPPKADPPKADPPKADPPADPKPKGEKAFSKTEMEAEIAKRIAAEKKKWDDEKDLTELEKLKKENADLIAANRLSNAKDEVLAALKAEGNKSPELAFAAMKDGLQFDDTGKLLNTKDLIANFKTTYPDQFGTEKPAAGIDGGAGQKGSGEKLTKEKLATMTPTEINALDWAEVSKVMAEK